MTREQIENMPAGREMDEAITRLLYPEAKAIIIMPKYSTDIKAAWEIVESIDTDFVLFDVGLQFSGWNASFYESRDKGFYASGKSHMEKTAPLAICRAFLLYKMEAE